MRDTALHSSRTLVLICALATVAQGQDRHEWQSLTQLQAGDSIRLSLKTGPVKGAFQNWTPQQVTVGTVTAGREDVLKIERYRRGGGLGKRAAIGAAIGFGGGFAIGAAAVSCNKVQFGPCFTRGQGGAVAGAVGAVVGAGIGALLPRHTKELIYSVK